MLLRFAGYKPEDIQAMDELSVFRRFFIVSSLIKDLFQGVMGGGEVVSSSEASEPAAIGRISAPIQGTAAPRGRRRTSRQRPAAPPPATPEQGYPFPTGN